VKGDQNINEYVLFKSLQHDPRNEWIIFATFFDLEDLDPLTEVISRDI
jgi:hypothetical protein